MGKTCSIHVGKATEDWQSMQMHVDWSWRQPPGRSLVVLIDDRLVMDRVVGVGGLAVTALGLVVGGPADGAMFVGFILLVALVVFVYPLRQLEPATT
jgi:hypothetical protein